MIEDFIAFRVVCASWRFATNNDDFDVFLPQVPLLMLADKDNDFGKFYSLAKKKSFTIISLQSESAFHRTVAYMVYRGRDMGAYNLENGTIEAFYLRSSRSCFSPPMWVTPSM